MGAGSGKMPEVLVIGLRVNTPGIPVEVIDLIAGQRKSGIVFVCVHEGEFEGTVREECALAVRRNVPVRLPVMCRSRKCSPANGGRPARSRWNYRKGTPTAARRRWTTCGIRCARRRFSIPRTEPIWTRESPAGAQIVTLKAAEEKLSRDHQRAKNPAQRNEIYAKLHKIRTQLAQLEQ